MAKSKQSRPGHPHASPPAAATSAPATHVAANPPAQNPTLLVGSAALFALWFVFLLIVALWG